MIAKPGTDFPVMNTKDNEGNKANGKQPDKKCCIGKYMDETIIQIDNCFLAKQATIDKNSNSHDEHKETVKLCVSIGAKYLAAIIISKMLKNKTHYWMKNET